MNKVNSYILISLTYFFIAAFVGLILRLFPITNLNATYKFIVHTHSHIALLGWIYVALTSLIYHLGIANKVKKKYTLLFWTTQLTIIGMLFTFPFIGYALYSIVFSTLFLICSYWFYYFFKKNNHFNSKSISYKFITTSLVFMIFSSIGPWSLGVIMNTLGSTSHWYKNAIYFYLHFQYNGWFIFCLIGLFYYILEEKRIRFSIPKALLFYKLMLLSCILTLFLSFLWINPPKIIYAIAAFGALLQLFTVYIFYNQIKKNYIEIKNIFGQSSSRLLLFVFILCILKITLQALTSLPYFANLTTYILDFVIGYLHLIFLGVVTLALLLFLGYFKLIKIPAFWLKTYLIGFISSEALIFYKGFCTWQQLTVPENYFLFLVICSALIPVGILGILINNLFPNYFSLTRFL